MTASRDAFTASGNEYFINVGEQSKILSAGSPGRVIGELVEQAALALEVHQAFEANTSRQVQVLSAYPPAPSVGKPGGCPSDR
ncbi:hypothetical protein [Actinomadura decatromicini]|uniref:Uncharacterized protein n=1 Tax=Actinomadura decatromicini TaxID=2604572 RepID=A0A5D3FZ23_9ACTN|nr:hypothetical protein [Actinomadura decatromicini]TYK53433.1 hypothetical protein FXF68_06985 [Actinomadura decatromicini]